jgi:hypothetical protein
MGLFGKVKSVAEIEQERLQLSNDFKVYTEVEESEKLKEFLLLKEKVESTPFKVNKKEIENLNYKGSQEESLMKKYLKLEKNQKLVDFYKTASSDDLKKFKAIKDSSLPDTVKELEQFIKSGRYKAELSAFKKKQKRDKTFTDKWETTEAFKKEKQYRELSESADFIFYSKFSSSKLYKNYLSVDGSSLLNQFENLKQEVLSTKFKERKAYLEDKERYKKTDDYKALVEYDKLKNDPGIVLYFKYNDTDSFKFFREWALTFDNDFSSKMNGEWSYITPIAALGPGRNFSVKDQLQYYKDNHNFDVENSILTLEAKAEKTQGLYWDEQFGFVERTFDYSSGLVHSLNFFKQEYGLFEIKLKASKIKGVISSISLVDEEEEICIRMATLESRKASGGVVYTNHGQKQFSKVNLNFHPAGYAIVSVEWLPDRIEWKVNNKVIGSVSQNIPHEKLGIRIETEVLKATTNLPHRLDIDWIRCYKRNK